MRLPCRQGQKMVQICRRLTAIGQPITEGKIIRVSSLCWVQWRETNFFLGCFYKLALLDFELIFEVKMQESEGV